jgi:hypothetical protein
MLKRSWIAITALCLVTTTSATALASLGDDGLDKLMGSVNPARGFVAGQRLILNQEHAFFVLKNNVPQADQPNAAQAGEWVTLPAGASIDVIGDAQADAQYGSVVNIAPFDVEPDSVVPADFVVTTADLKTANAQIVIPNILDAQIEQQAQDLTEKDAFALDQSESQNNFYYLQEARLGRGGGGRHAGRGGGRHAGMTYCLMNVEIKAHQMGICPYKISEGYARRSLPGFISKCNMISVGYSDNLPLGSICASEGTGHHFCGGARCGDVKMKVGANTWYNGVGPNSSQHAIGFTYGCVAPSGSGLRQVALNSGQRTRHAAKAVHKRRRR